MQNCSLRGLLISPSEQKCEMVEIIDNLENLYELLDCRTIDIISRSIGGFLYDIVCDDEGLFKDFPVVSALTEDGMPCLVGKLFICNCPIDDEGELESLAFPQIFDLLKRCVIYEKDDVQYSAILLDNP